MAEKCEKEEVEIKKAQRHKHRKENSIDFMFLKRENDYLKEDLKVLTSSSRKYGNYQIIKRRIRRRIEGEKSTVAPLNVVRLVKMKLALSGHQL